MTDQIDKIYLKIFLYFGLYQNHLRRIKLSTIKTIIKSKEKQLIITAMCHGLLEYHGLKVLLHVQRITEQISSLSKKGT